MTAPQPTADVVERAPAPSGRRTGLGLPFGVGLAFIVLWAAVAAVTGRASIAFGDGWSYLRVAFRFADTNHFELNRYVSTAFFGQALLAFPVLKVFPNSIVAANTWMIAVAIAALGAVVAIMRLYCSARETAFGVAVFFATPLLALSVVGFHTDLPAFTAQMSCVALGAYALKRSSVLMFWGALSVGFLAFTIRDFAGGAAFALVLVAGIAVWAGASSIPMRTILTSAGVLVVACLAFAWWRRGLPNIEPFPLELSAPNFAKWAPRCVVTLGMYVIPAALVVNPVRLVRDAFTRARFAATVVMALSALLFGAVAVNATGPMDDAFGYPRASAGSSGPGPIWWSLGLLGAYAVAVVALSAVALGARSNLRATAAVAPERLVLPTATLAAVPGIFVYVAFSATYPPFPRYLLPFVPGTIVLLLRTRSVLAPVSPRAGALLGTAALAVATSVSLVIAVTVAAFVVTPWNAAQELVDRGAPVERVHGFGPWQGFREPYILRDPANLRAAINLSDQRYCAFATRTPRQPPGWTEYSSRSGTDAAGKQWVVKTYVRNNSECARALAR